MKLYIAIITMLSLVAVHCIPSLTDFEDVEALLGHRSKRQSGISDDNSRDPHLVDTRSLPYRRDDRWTLDYRYMPVVGNGHMAMSVYNDSIFLDGVYNGGGEFSRRARIPAEAALRVSFSSSVTNIQRRFRFNFDTGVFEENITLPHCDIVHRTYCHKYFTRVFIQEIIMAPRAGQTQQCKLQLDHLRDNYTDDFEIFKKESFNGADWTRRLRTHVAEGDGTSPRDVYMFFDDIPRDLSLPRSERNPQRNVYVMTLDTDRSRAERAYTEIQRVLATPYGYNEVYKEHLDAWGRLWQYARIEIEGNVRLAKVTKAALYYMMSSLPPPVSETGGRSDTYQPPNPYMGLARSGLGAGCNTTDYNGHVFWDHEMFMMPPMTILYPSIGKEMLMYRMNRRDAAKQRASQTGNQGERFPWESAITGREITPIIAKYQQENAHHVTGAVGWAARNYYSATRDQEYLDSNGGCDISKEIARFWQYKMKWNNTKARWNLNECQGPNDLHSYVNNNAYTNALATLSIQWARYVACLCRRNETDEIPDEWMRRSVDLYMPYDDRYRRHNEFDDYEYRSGNQSLKQADTTLLYYPLGWNTTKEIMRNDLEFYEGKLIANPPALTYSIHAIGWLRVPDKSRGDNMFERSYSSYMQEPFKTWTEYPNSQGSVNFLPGMGGFLSTLLFGYAGIHIKPEEMMVYPPTLPPGVNTLRIYGVHYLGNSLEFEIQSSGVTLRNTGGDGKHQLRVRLNNTHCQEGGRPEEREFRQGSSIQATNTGLTIFSTTATNCKPPDDTLRVRYSPVFGGTTTTTTTTSTRTPKPITSVRSTTSNLPVLTTMGESLHRCECRLMLEVTQNCTNSTSSSCVETSLIHEFPDTSLMVTSGCQGCVDMFRVCPEDCFTTATSFWGTEGLSNTIIEDTPWGPRPKTLGQMFCERHFDNIPSPGGTIVSSYKMAECEIESRQNVFNQRLCCVMYEVPIAGFVPVWDYNCNGIIENYEANHVNW